MSYRFASALSGLLMLAIGCSESIGGRGEEVDARSGGDDPIAAAECGDGQVDADEGCDDDNASGGDGCSAECQIEPGWSCPDLGGTCVDLQVCGNAFLEDGEACDDRNQVDGDGCSADCRLEAGWSCPVPGIRCGAARCGDGLVVGGEECDDHNPDDGDGCSAACRVEEGFACAEGGCRETTCGDQLVEGTEECDDANYELGDGCDPFCHREPMCSGGDCAEVCGDNVLQHGVTSTEECDDGNLRGGDGCSAQCRVEVGFACEVRTEAPPSVISAAIVYRDFHGHDTANGHPDFQRFGGADRGIVEDRLGPDHKPTKAMSGATATTTSRTNFDTWFRDTPGVNRTFADTMAFSRTGAGTYVFDDGYFFPLDGRGFVTTGEEPERPGRDGNRHNFSFTSELRYWFTYVGGEVLSFRGDDDVWVFINDRLAIDLGGVHTPTSASITLDGTRAAALGLVVGGVYELAVFQAERNTAGSSYRLTLAGFRADRSVCSASCGDGITSSTEACDDGVNDGGYGSCSATCQGFGPRCGDAIVQPDHEACDDGVNDGDYGSCLPTCQPAPRCGDGVLQPEHEDCDGGRDNPNDDCSDTCEVIIG